MRLLRYDLPPARYRREWTVRLFRCRCHNEVRGIRYQFGYRRYCWYWRLCK